MERAPEPTPASSTRCPGPMSAAMRMAPEVLGVDDLRAARHLQHHVAQRRSQHEEGAPGRAGDGASLAAADQVVVRDDAGMGVERGAGGTSVMR